MSEKPATAPPNYSRQPQERHGSKEYARCLSIIILLPIIAWMAGVAGCSKTEETPQPRTSSVDPNIRYIGSRGAVAGYDNHGRTTRLAPGTSVRPTGSTYMDPAGPKKVYVVLEGDLKGMPVPLSGSDLRPQ